MADFTRLVLSLSLSGSALILALLAVRPLLRNRLSKAGQYYLWIIVLLRLALPFTPSLGITGWLSVSRVAPAVQAQTVLQDQSLSESLPESSDEAPAISQETAVSGPQATAVILPSVDVMALLGYIWCVGAALTLLYKVSGYVSFTRKVRREAQPVTDSAAKGLLNGIAAELGLKSPPLIYTGAHISSPMLVGLIRPAVLLPEAAAAVDTTALLYTLRHELTHLKRRDILYKWLAELILCLHWFNPLAYLMVRRIERACELSCDESVALTLDADQRLEYGKTVLDAAEQCARGGRLLSASLRGEKTNIKERLGTILKAGKKPKASLVMAVALAICLSLTGIVLAACSSGKTVEAMNTSSPQAPSPSQAATPPTATTTVPSGDSAKDEQAVRTLVTDFGKVLKNVSLLAPADALLKSLDDNYTPFVSPALLAIWKGDPANAAPGRVTSSPWPDRIDITSVLKNDDGSYTVTGNIIEVTSTEVQSGTAFATRPVTITVMKTGERWLISGWKAGAEVTGTHPSAQPSVNFGNPVYRNTAYGFEIALPQDWRTGFTTVNETWKGTYVDGSARAGITGPQILIRSPKWTQANPTQDIPIMIFTYDQWNNVKNEKLAVSAAPIPPSELGRNSVFVFALPARYNFASLPGYEEVDKIIQSKPLRPTEDISVRVPAASAQNAAPAAATAPVRVPGPAAAPVPAITEAPASAAAPAPANVTAQAGSPASVAEPAPALTAAPDRE